MSARSKSIRWATKPLGHGAWNAVVRATGVVGLLGIAGVVAWPDSAPLVGFALITIWVNGPLGMFLPATYEPILMLFGALYAPVLVALLGILGTLYVEGINYFLYRRVLETRALQAARSSRLVRSTERLFRLAPFWTVWLCSWSPLPYWVVRIVAPLARYPVPKYLIATFLGRFPRLWFFAALGLRLQVSAGTLAFITLAAMAAFGVVAAVKMRPGPRGKAIAPAASFDHHFSQESPCGASCSSSLRTRSRLRMPSPSLPPKRWPLPWPVRVGRSSSSRVWWGRPSGSDTLHAPSLRTAIAPSSSSRSG